MMTGYVYMMASKQKGTIYIGVTSDLIKRVYEHRTGLIDGFTKKYHCKLLVWYEIFEHITDAIQREKSLKKWLRKWKIDLIEKSNPTWRDLYHDIARP